MTSRVVLLTVFVGIPLSAGLMWLAGQAAPRPSVSQQGLPRLAITPRNAGVGRRPVPGASAVGSGSGAARGAIPTIGPEPSRSRGQTVPSATVREPEIRVGLLPEPAREVSIEVTGSYSVRLPGSTRVLHQGTRLGKSTARAAASGLAVGSILLPATRVEIVPASSPAVWVNGHQYRGRVRLYRQASGKLLAVNVLPLEEYVASVVDSEMPTEFGVEARKAQAIVARTYALYQMRQAGREALVDLYASVRSQKYLGYQYVAADGRKLAGESEASRRIARETRGLVCTHGGVVFCTYYCAACGGRTLAGKELFSDAAPPLTSVACTYCEPARLYRWTATMSRGDVERALRKALADKGQSLGTLTALRAAGSVAPGGLPRFEVRDGTRRIPLSGAELRTALGARGLYSPRFSVIETRGDYVFAGQGHGHGVGLCQWGARGQSQAGRTAAEILRYYYPGSQLSRVGY